MAFILVVEDDEPTKALIQRIFERANYETVCVLSAREGLEIAFDTPPLVAIVDIRLPLTNGFWLIEQFKADTTLQKVPIVVLTADTNNDTRDQAALLGCDLFIAKPFSPRDLLKNVEYLAAQAQPHI